MFAAHWQGQSVVALLELFSTIAAKKKGKKKPKNPH